ncbi:hypothetical protein NPIL_268491 [Nephila pilipes]|uniref:Uncharacterized protein n=1 Tax=Nephila pilipes TaxID=299642 RepID=A0A8X6U7Y4_NEPPI|nr:hypothetical protein NPIL_268491 [Nephila pilipes]
MENLVLLIMDNAGGLPVNLYYEGVQIEFLPPNTTSLLQPMDEGSNLSHDKPPTCLDPVDLIANVISVDAVDLLLPRSAVAIASATTASVADKRVRTADAEIANVVELQNAE